MKTRKMMPEKNQKASNGPFTPSVIRRGRNFFKLRDVTRAVRSVQAAGLPIGAVEVSQDGTIRILPKNAAEHAGGDNDLDALIAKREKDARPA
jgi:hypothetical protein